MAMVRLAAASKPEKIGRGLQKLICRVKPELQQGRKKSKSFVTGAREGEAPLNVRDKEKRDPNHGETVPWRNALSQFAIKKSQKQ